VSPICRARWQRRCHANWHKLASRHTASVWHQAGQAFAHAGKLAGPDTKNA
jgi:hypothetical protein